MPGARSTRRRLLQQCAALASVRSMPLAAGAAALNAQARPRGRVRPQHPDWPSARQWQILRDGVGDALLEVQSPWPACIAATSGSACTQLFKSVRNPYFLGDDVALTQSLGWVGAWISQPSVYAVAARTSRDVAAAVNFARRHRLRLVVKGGGHSYHGNSNASDSLLLWTRQMNRIELHSAFRAQGRDVIDAPVRAVSVGAGALWAHVYDAVTTRGGGYVQGGGCLTVGVAGLVLSGGFGSFSKAFGLAASSLIEAEVVTADGAVRVVNEAANPDLFWALKGGGGGSFGIVTRLTLRVHELPQTIGVVNLTVRAKSAAAYRRLVGMVVDFYARNLMNPHWGEQIRFRPDNVLAISMLFQGLSGEQAADIWHPFLRAIDASPDEFTREPASNPILATQARQLWSPGLFKRADDRPGAPPTNVFWPGDAEQAGQVLQAYQSAWLPASLLKQPETLADRLFAASRHWSVSLHFNKGLAGASPEVIAAARNTAMNPAVLNAFALAICAAEQAPAYPGVPGHEPDESTARRHAARVSRAANELRKGLPALGSYLAESDFFEPGWAQAYWGPNHNKLAAIKAKYDPQGLFFVHHGIGSDQWSADGFERKTGTRT
jgi:FAD binding domain/Berberine and berberine like